MRFFNQTIDSLQSRRGRWSQSDVLTILMLMSFGSFSGEEKDWSVALSMGLEWIFQVGFLESADPCRVYDGLPILLQVGVRHTMVRRFMPPSRLHRLTLLLYPVDRHLCQYHTRRDTRRVGDLQAHLSQFWDRYVRCRLGDPTQHCPSFVARSLEEHAPLERHRAETSGCRNRGEDHRRFPATGAATFSFGVGVSSVL